MRDIELVGGCSTCKAFLSFHLHVLFIPAICKMWGESMVGDFLGYEFSGFLMMHFWEKPL